MQTSMSSVLEILKKYLIPAKHDDDDDDNNNDL